MSTSYLQDFSEFNSTIDDESLNWNTFSFETELSSVESINKKNLEVLNEHCNVINQMKTLQVPDPAEGKIEDIKEFYLKASQSYKAAYEKICAEAESISKMNREMTQKIAKAKRELAKEQQKINGMEIGESEEKVKQLGKYYLFAIKHYSKKFGMDITHIEHEDHYESIVTFKEHEQFPINFFINLTNDKIIKIDASSVLTPTQHERFNKKFEGFTNPLAILCTLRNIVLKKK